MTALMRSASFFVLLSPFHLISNEDAPILSDAPVCKKQGDYDTLYDLMKDFLDPDIKSDAKMSYWLREFAYLYKKQTKERQKQLRPFFADIKQAADNESHIRFGKAIQNHMTHLREVEPNLTTYVKERLEQPNALTKYSRIIKDRLKRR